MDGSRVAAPCAKLTLLGIVLAAAGALAAGSEAGASDPSSATPVPPGRSASPHGTAVAAGAKAAVAAADLFARPAIARDQARFPGSAAPGGPARFVDVAAESGLTIPVIGGGAEKKHIVESTTGGVALFDQDGDGDLEIFFANGSRLGGFPEGEEPRSSLYRNDGGWRFAEAAGELGAAHAGWGMGVAAADWDGDGRVDLYLANYGANALYRNEGERFREVAGAAGVAHPGWGSAAAFGDYDGDGDLDFYLANYVDFDPGFVPEDRDAYCNWRGLTDVFCGPNGLPGARDSYFRNEGPESGWVFADAGDEAGLREYEYYGLGAVAGDYDDDGDLDLYVANDSTPNVLYRNDGGRFVDIAVAAGAAFEKDGREQSGMGVAAGDPDGDGDLDLFVTNFSHDHNTYYENRGPAGFLDVSWKAGLGLSSLSYLGWGAGFFDCDHDGDEDLFVANGHVFPAVDRGGLGTRYRQPNQLYENTGAGRFIDVSPLSGSGFEVELSSRGSALGDLDGDGDLDIAVSNLDAAPTLLRNDGGGRGNWLILRLRDRGPNTHAVGARVTARAGKLRMVREVRAGGSYLSQDDTGLHFGLGPAPEVDLLRVRWPDGAVQELSGVAANQVLTLVRDGS